MISTILKEFGYNTEDISEELVNVIVEAMENNASKYIKVAHKIELTKNIENMTDKQRDEFETKIKNMLHTNRIRIEENSLVTHYYSYNSYYDREKLRDVVREALAAYRADVHVDSEVEIKKEEPAEESGPVEASEEKEVKKEEVEVKKTVVLPKDMKMTFENANALGDPTMTTKTAYDEVAVQKKHMGVNEPVKPNNGKLTAADEF